MYDRDMVQMTGAFLEKRRKDFRGRDSTPADDRDRLVNELDSDPMIGGDWSAPEKSWSGSGFPTADSGHSGGNKVDRDFVNVRSCNLEPTGVCRKSPVSGKPAE